jgi:uncharacterized protein
MTKVRVKIDDIRESGLTFHLQASPSLLDLEVQETHFQDPFTIDFTIDRLKKEYIITGSFQTRISYRCSRCLKDFSISLEEEFQFVFSRDLRDIDNPEWYCEEDQSIDVGIEIRECALLALVQKPLCDENCKGLCPVCGKDLNVSSCDCASEKIDQRLEGLKKFLK